MFLELYSKGSQEKRNLISSITNLVYEIPHMLPSNLTDLRRLGNIKKISNLGGDIAQCLVLRS